VIPAGLALAASGVSAAGAADTSAAHLAPALASAASGGNVIVILRDQHADLNLRTQGAARRAADFADQAPIVASIKASGGTDITQLVAVSAVSADVSAQEVATLRANPAVEQIVPDAAEHVDTGGPAGPVVPAADVAKASPGAARKALCPGIPGEPGKPAQEPEALADIHASDGNPDAPDEANSIATGKGVIVAIQGMNNLAGNPNFQRPDGSPVVIDAPSYTADHGNSESYGDASSVAAQGRSPTWWPTSTLRSSPSTRTSYPSPMAAPRRASPPSLTPPMTLPWPRASPSWCPRAIAAPPAR
jgi:hypothetical protein